MSDDATVYRHNGMTVWFDTDPKGLKCNPFDVVSEFGKVNTIGRGNSFDEADIYREALDEIVERTTDARIVEIAERAMNATNPLKVPA
jgi:hypothetical protein